jgi:hypothetical protein
VVNAANESTVVSTAGGRDITLLSNQTGESKISSMNPNSTGKSISLEAVSGGRDITLLSNQTGESKISSMNPNSTGKSISLLFSYPEGISNLKVLQIKIYISISFWRGLSVL